MKAYSRNGSKILVHGNHAYRVEKMGTPADTVDLIKEILHDFPNITFVDVTGFYLCALERVGQPVPADKPNSYRLEPK